jgi:hypothetical protein
VGATGRCGRLFVGPQRLHQLLAAQLVAERERQQLIARIAVAVEFPDFPTAVGPVLTSDVRKAVALTRHDRSGRIDQFESRDEPGAKPGRPSDLSGSSRTGSDWLKPDLLEGVRIAAQECLGESVSCTAEVGRGHSRRELTG